MRKMLINAPARGDLDSIDNYLRFEKCNPQAADTVGISTKYLQELSGSSKHLVESPASGASRDTQKPAASPSRVRD